MTPRQRALLNTDLFAYFRDKYVCAARWCPCGSVCVCVCACMPFNITSNRWVVCGTRFTIREFSMDLLSHRFYLIWFISFAIRINKNDFHFIPRFWCGAGWCMEPPMICVKCFRWKCCVYFICKFRFDWTLLFVSSTDILLFIKTVTECRTDEFLMLK